MPGEFEKEMQERVQDFRISPRPQVWKQVEAALPEEKRKRRFAFWWWLPLGLLISGGIWYAVGGNKTTSMAENTLPVTLQAPQPTDSFTQVKDVTLNKKNTTSPALSAIVAENAKPANEKTNKATVKIKDVSETNNKVAVSSNEVSKSNNKPKVKSYLAKVNSNRELQNSSKVFENSNKAIQNTNNTDTGTKSVLQTGNDNSEITKKAIARNKENENTTYKGEERHRLVKEGEDAMLQSTITKPIEGSSKETLQTKDSAATTLPENPEINLEATKNTSNTDTVSNAVPAADNPPQVPAPDKKAMQVSWQFFASAAMSNTKSALFGSMNKSLENAARANSMIVTPGGNISNNSAQRATPGFSYAVGIERLQKMGKRWQWYAAVQYSYLSNHQQTGAKKDSAISIFDNTGFSNTADRSKALVPGFYYTGNTLTHTNTIHQLGLQTGLQYTLNPAGKKPFSLRGGLMANWQIATKQLLHDATKSAYYYSPTTTHHFTMGMQLGINWKIGKRLSLGAFYQYIVTPINKIDIGIYLHWHLTGVRVAIPLGKH